MIHRFILSQALIREGCSLAQIKLYNVFILLGRTGLPYNHRLTFTHVVINASYFYIYSTFGTSLIFQNIFYISADLSQVIRIVLCDLNFNNNIYSVMLVLSRFLKLFTNNSQYVKGCVPLTSKPAFVVQIIYNQRTSIRFKNTELNAVDQCK